MRLRRSLFFVAPATAAGRPSPAGSSGPAAVCPAPSCCPGLPRPRRVRLAEEKSKTVAQDARSLQADDLGLHVSPSGEAKCVRVTRHESRHTEFMSVRFAGGAQGSQNKKTNNRRPVTASLSTISRHFSGGGGGAPEQVFKRRWLGDPEKVRRILGLCETARSAAVATAPASLRLVPLRRPQNESMPRKGNVRNCIDRMTRPRQPESRKAAATDRNRLITSFVLSGRGTRVIVGDGRSAYTQWLHPAAGE